MPPVPHIDDVDEAIFLVEGLLLQRGSSLTLYDKVANHIARQKFLPRARFKILAKALGESTPLGAVLRYAVLYGLCKLITLHGEAVLQKPREQHSYVFVLLSGIVISFTKERPFVLRHADAFHVFAEEAIMQSHGVLGYRAAPSCVVLALDPSRLRNEDVHTLQCVVGEQLPQIKSACLGE